MKKIIIAITLIAVTCAASANNTVCEKLFTKKTQKQSPQKSKHSKTYSYGTRRNVY